jgi:hypothetical protein
VTSTLFISYRRDDAKWAASAIHSELCKHLGDDNVFKDVESLLPGRPWRHSLVEALDQCEAVLVLIGGKWLEGGSVGRLHQDGDLVREEIAVSLRRAIPVVPVTLDDTPLPSSNDLPDDIAELVDMQAISVSHETYKQEIVRLISRLGLRGGDEQKRDVTSLPNVQDSGLREGLIQFLSRYSQWSFSPLRIVNWGSRQEGFAFLAKHTSSEIQDELKAMVTAGQATTRTSKKGGTLYRLA